MELANQPPSQEILPRQTSSLCSTYAAIGAVSPPAQAVVGRVALVLPGLQLLPASGRESGPEPLEEAVVFSCLFQRWPPPRRESRHVIEHREELSGRWPWIFRFWPTLSPFHLTLSPFRPPLSLFQLRRPRVHPAPLCVEQVVVPRLSLVFGRSKSLRKR